MSRSASIWQRFAALPNEHPAKTLLIVFLVALVCAALVSFTAVQLRPLQEQNRRAEREQKLNQMLAALPGLDQLLRDSGADQLQSRLIDMSSGKTVADAAGEFVWLFSRPRPARNAWRCRLSAIRWRSAVGRIAVRCCCSVRAGRSIYWCCRSMAAAISRPCMPCWCCTVISTRSLRCKYRSRARRRDWGRALPTRPG